MRLETERLSLRTLTVEMAPFLLEYLARNEEFLRPWSPSHPAQYDQAEVGRMIRLERKARIAGSGYRFHISPGNERRIIGSVGLTNIVYGAFLSCFVGYKLDAEYVNRGYMTEALRRVADFAFADIGLHRLEANIMPRNGASLRIMQKLGFECEGISSRYLLIDGVWEDHARYVLFSDKGPAK
jgi:ribosomal-protein-alanine N-acetyltransferase